MLNPAASHAPQIYFFTVFSNLAESKSILPFPCARNLGALLHSSFSHCTLSLSPSLADLLVIMPRIKLHPSTLTVTQVEPTNTYCSFISSVIPLPSIQKMQQKSLTEQPGYPLQRQIQSQISVLKILQWCKPFYLIPTKNQNTCHTLQGTAYSIPILHLSLHALHFFFDHSLCALLSVFFLKYINNVPTTVPLHVLFQGLKHFSQIYLHGSLPDYV